MITRMAACFFCVFVCLSRFMVLVHAEGVPRFKGKMKTVYYASVGESVKLRCRVTGTDHSTYSRTLIYWRYEGKLIKTHEPGKSFRFHKKPGRYLKIVRVEKTDAGVYTCIGHNEFGVIQKNITLKIKKKEIPQARGSPPKFKGSYKPVLTYKTGETAKLKCRSTGDPDPDVQWFKNGRSLHTKRTSISHNGYTLNLRYLDLHDSGKYSCLVSNKLGSINRTFTVKVKARNQKPTFDDSETRNVTVSQGEVAKLECRPWSTGKPEFKWKRWGNQLNKFKGSKDLPGSKRINTKYILNETGYALTRIRYEGFDDSHYEGFLFIKNSSKEDQGKYSCVVTNGHGTDSLDIHLFVTITAFTASTVATTVARMASTSSSLQTTEPPVPIILVVGLTVSIVVTMIFIVVLILCCRKQRKDLEKQYVLEYKPAELLEQYKQAGINQEMQKTPYPNLNSENWTRNKSRCQPYDNAKRTLQDVCGHMDKRFASAKDTRGSRCCFGNRRRSRGTIERISSSDRNPLDSQTTSETTVDRHETKRNSSNSGDEVDYFVPSARPPEARRSKCEETGHEDGQKACADPHSKSSSLRESAV